MIIKIQGQLVLFLIYQKRGEILKCISELSEASKEDEITCSPAMLNEFHFIVFLTIGHLDVVY